MATLPGLSRFSEDRPDVERQGPGRVETREANLAPPRLRPQASPVETYTRPPKPEENDNLARLTQSLASLNPSLMRFGEVMKKEDDAADAKWNAKVSGMSSKDVMQKLQDGSDPELTAGLTKAKHQELLAARIAQSVVDEAKQEWSTSNRDQMNVDEFIAGKVRGTLDKFGGHGKHFTNEFIRLATPGLDQLRTAQVRHNVERQQAEVAQGASALFERTIANGVSEGKPPEEIAKALRAEMKGNEVLARLDPRQQEAEVLALAQKYAADGQYDLVRAIVSSPAADGTNLLQNREHGSKAVQLIESADTKRRERNREAGFEGNMKFFEQAKEGSLDKEGLIAYHKANPGVMSDGHVESLISKNQAQVEARLKYAQELEEKRGRREAADRSVVSVRTERRTALLSGQLHRLGPATIVKPNGETQEVPAEKNQQEAVEEWVEESRQLAQRKGENLQQRFARELPVVLEAGVVHPEWKNTLQGGFRAASVATLSGDKPPARLAESLAIYKELHAKAPNMIMATAGKEGAEYYEYMRVATEGMELPLDKANSVVMQLIKDPVKARSLLTEGTRQEIKAAAKRVGAVNQGYVEEEIQRRSVIFAGLGNSTEKSLELATADLKRTHIEINGHYLQANDRALPPDFKELVEARIREYVRQHGKSEGVDRDDLTIVPSTSGSGAWEIVMTNGIAVDDPTRMFTLDDLKKQKAHAEDARRAALTTRSDKRKDTPLPPSMMKNGRGNVPTTK